MATSDLHNELLKDSFKADVDTEKRVTQARPSAPGHRINRVGIHSLLFGSGGDEAARGPVGGRLWNCVQVVRCPHFVAPQTPLVHAACISHLGYAFLRALRLTIAAMLNQLPVQHWSPAAPRSGGQR